MFLIVGVPRSGTTLLSTMLNNHSEIFVDDMAISRKLIHAHERYEVDYLKSKDLQERFRKSIKSDRRINDFLNIEQIAEGGITLTIAEAFTDKAKGNKKNILGDKSPAVINYLKDFSSLFPNAKIIMIVRDARANVQSLVKRQYMDLQLASQMWKDWNIKGLSFMEWLGPNKMIKIHYEDLLVEPNKPLNKICDFLGVEYEEEMLKLETSTVTKKESAYVKAKIDKTKINSWRKILTSKQIKKIELVTGDLMGYLGYEIEFPRDSYHSLSYLKKLLLQIRQMGRLIFVARRKAMSKRTIVDIEVPLSTRIRRFLSAIFKGIFNDNWFKNDSN